MNLDSSTKLKRCISVPVINTSKLGQKTGQTAPTDTLKDDETPKKMDVPMLFASNPPSREVSPAPTFNLFSTRARRYSASFSPLNTNGAGGPRLSLRVSQLRQEECADINSREQNHEREVHSAMQISQSWEDLTLVAENWSCKSDDVTNPLQVSLGSGLSCSSPSPTSRCSVGTNSNSSIRALPYGLSPSPTRRTFATRRSMSPIAMRPSQLGPVKRRFDIDGDNIWSNAYSPPPFKKIFVESRASSPSSSICASPDSGTYEGRVTPKLYISKLCSSNSSNSPMSASPIIDAGIDMQTSNLSPMAVLNTPSSINCSSISSASSTSSSEDIKPSKKPMPPLPVSEDTQF